MEGFFSQSLCPPDFCCSSWSNWRFWPWLPLECWPSRWSMLAKVGIYHFPRLSISPPAKSPSVKRGSPTLLGANPPVLTPHQSGHWQLIDSRLLLKKPKNFWNQTNLTTRLLWRPWISLKLMTTTTNEPTLSIIWIVTRFAQDCRCSTCLFFSSVTSLTLFFSIYNVRHPLCIYLVNISQCYCSLSHSNIFILPYCHAKFNPILSYLCCFHCFLSLIIAYYYLAYHLYLHLVVL